jgi:hypothetical protein
MNEIKKQLKYTLKWFDLNLDVNGDNLDEYISNVEKENNINICIDGEEKPIKRTTLLLKYANGKFTQTTNKAGMGLKPRCIKKSVIVSGDIYVTEDLQIKQKSELQKDEIDIDYYRDDNKIRTPEELIYDMKCLKCDLDEIRNNVFYFDKKTTGLKDTNAMKTFMFTYLRCLKCESISFDEKEIIEEASIGPMLCGRKQLIKDHYMYDINSSYPYIFQSQDFKFPIGEGNYKTVDKIEGYGFFKITVKTDNDFTLFKVNEESDWCTHIDIMKLDNIGYEYELIKTENNAYIYDESVLINSSLIFKKFINAMYDLKTEGNGLSKQCINCIWGKLTQPRTLTTQLTKESLEQFDDCIKIIHPKLGTIVYYDKKQPYKTGYARMKPFILAMGRYNLSKVCFEVIKKGYKIVRVHTDSILTNMKPDEFSKIATIGNEIGQWKIDKKIDSNCEYEVKNSLIVSKT